MAKLYAPSRVDPSRTSSLRRGLQQQVNLGFARLKADLLQLVDQEDAFGLAGNLVGNYSAAEPRDAQGQWTRGAGHAHLPTTLVGVVAKLRSAGARLSHLEEVASHYAGDKIAHAVSRLPKQLQHVVNGSYHVLKAGTVAAFASWKLGQALAERVSIQKGATPEEARRFRGVLSTMDVVSFKPLSIGMGMAGLGGLAIGLASLAPPVTAGYLAYSTARNPAATYRAAKGLVGDFAGSVRSRFTHNVAEEGIQRLYDALHAHHFDDWYIALLSAAMSDPRVSGVDDAVQVANAAYHKQPRDQSRPAADDVQAILGGNHANPLINTFCPTGPGGGVDPTCSIGKPTIHPAEIDSTAAAGVGQKYKKFVVGIKAAKAFGNLEEVSLHHLTATQDYINPTRLAELEKKGVKALKQEAAERLIIVRQGGKDYVGDGHHLIEAMKRSGLTHFPAWVVPVDASGKPTSPRKLVANAAQQFRFESDPRKVEQFQSWLRDKYQKYLTGKDQEQAWEFYIGKTYQKGAGRAFDEVNKARKVAKSRDVYQGAQEQFLRALNANPNVVQQVKLLAGRAFDDLEGVTADMSLRMSRTLTDGIIRGLSRDQIARNLAKEVDLSRDRAKVITYNEIVRAQAEGQLTALEEMGVEEVGAAVEWDTAHDLKVCRKCAPLLGIVLKVSEARGMIPRHPRCRCAWKPVVTSEKGQVATQGRISGAIKRSRKGDASGWGPGASISRKRPTFLNNVFCPTGPGGGVDPHCHEGAASSPASSPASVSKFVGALVGKAEHVHSARVEREVAGAIRGRWEEDNAPYDVLKGKHGVEVKSLLKGQKQAISVHPDALYRKAQWAGQKPGRTFHTVVVDERATYGGGAAAEHYSGNRLYYKRGSGRYSLSQMHPVKNAAELHRLIRAADHELPEKARGSLPTGVALRSLKQAAEKAHAARLAKDRVRKARLKAERKAKQLEVAAPAGTGFQPGVPGA